VPVRVTLAMVGRLKAGAERELYERYRDRFEATGRTIGLGPVQEIEIAESARGSPNERRKEEAEALLAKIPPGAILVALDEAGQAPTSEALARKIAQFRDEGAAGVVFAIGGADGHGQALMDAAALRLALGPMTLPHGLVRIVLAEQLYRVATILAGHPYHRGRPFV
jgi:23S rRNA (pseudouridine1915-N3)-methyltransferase